MATLTVYPDADTESTSVDGTVGNAVFGQSFATHRAAAGSEAYPSVATADIFTFVSNAGADQWGILRRGIYLFDTSALPNNCYVSAATFSVYGNSKADTLSLSPEVSINIYTSAPASDTNLVAGDFDSLGATALCDTPITYTNFDITDYNAFVLNATGLALINKTGITKLGIRESVYDAGGATPTHTASKLVGMNAHYADEAGTTKDPKLVITYIGGEEAGAIAVVEEGLHYVGKSGVEYYLHGTAVP